VAAFRVLMHAELEAYFEDLCTDVVDRVCAKWIADGRARVAVPALLGFAKATVRLPPEELDSMRDSMREAVERARKHFKNSVVLRNNGIKQKNVMSLLLPAGLRESDIDTTLVARLDAFGLNRGELVHSSALSVQRPPDPGDAFLAVRDIVLGLRRIDARLVLIRDE
jgi:hypothetical protein